MAAGIGRGYQLNFPGSSTRNRRLLLSTYTIIVGLNAVEWHDAKHMHTKRCSRKLRTRFTVDIFMTFPKLYKTFAVLKKCFIFQRQLPALHNIMRKKTKMTEPQKDRPSFVEAVPLTQVKMNKSARMLSRINRTRRTTGLFVSALSSDLCSDLNPKSGGFYSCVSYRCLLYLFKSYSALLT